MNPYVNAINVPWNGIPVKRNTEKEAIQEGFAVMRAFRVRRKGRQMIKTRTGRLTQRLAA